MAGTRTRAAHRPVDDLTRAKIQQTARDGKSRNAVAREFSVAGETVTRICAEVGITFDRTQTEAAVRAHSIDVAKDRLALVQEMIAEAREQMDLVNAPYLVWSFGGMDGNIHSHLLDSAPLTERNIAMRSAGIAFDKATKALEKSTDGLTNAHSLLDALADGFSKAAAEYESTLTDGE
jgi:hypothetical protein